MRRRLTIVGVAVTAAAAVAAAAVAAAAVAAATAAAAAALKESQLVGETVIAAHVEALVCRDGLVRANAAVLALCTVRHLQL